MVNFSPNLVILARVVSFSEFQSANPTYANPSTPPPNKLGQKNRNKIDLDSK